MTRIHSNFCIAFAVIVAIVVSGCERKSDTAPAQPKTREIEWIDPNEIQFSPTLHDSLPDDLLGRIKSVHAAFAEVDGTPLEKWVDDFKRDADPEGNVKIWEDMQVAYQNYCDGRELPLATRKEVFRVVLFRSMAAPADVLERIELSILSKDDATEIMKAYPSGPKPIEVIEVDQ